MVTVKEIYIEAKKSRNFQTYTAGMMVTLDEKENNDEELQEAIRKKYQALCRKACSEQIALDNIR